MILLWCDGNGTPQSLLHAVVGLSIYIYIYIYSSIHKSVWGCKWSHNATTSRWCRVPNGGIWVRIQVALWPVVPPAQGAQSVRLHATLLPHWFCIVFLFFAFTSHLSILPLGCFCGVFLNKYLCIFTLLILPCLLFVFSIHYCLINLSGRAALGPSRCICTVIEINYVSTTYI